jgi:hypothetical protein
VQGADFPQGASLRNCRGRLGVSHHEGVGVAPQPAACTLSIGAVVGHGDVQLARGAVGQLAMEVTVAIRHIGEVTDVFCGGGDPDGEAVVGQKSGAGDEMPLGADSRSSSRARYRRVIRYRGGYGPLLSTYRARAVVDAAGRSSPIRAPDGITSSDTKAARSMPKCRQQTFGLARPTAGVASGIPARYFCCSC